MKSLFRKSAAALTVGGIVLGSLVSAGLQAIALTSEQIVEQLRHVPVFTITDESGSPLVSDISNQDDMAPVTQIFISQEDAQAFIEGLRTNDPELAGSVRVTPVSLARVYEVALQGQEPDTRLEFIFVPNRTQVQSAVTILQEELQGSGQAPPSIDEFAGVPLFTARTQQAGEANDQAGYLTIQRGDEEVIPVFFTQEDLDALLSEIQSSQPDLASSLEPYVLRLEDLIYTLETSNSQELQQIRLIPSSETIRFLQQQQPQQPQPQQPQQ